MPANTAPIYPKSARLPTVQIPVSATALTRTDGVTTVGTDAFLLDSAVSPDGTFYRSIIIKPFATSAAQNTTATTVRVFVSSVNTGTTTAANTNMLGEVQIPLVSASNTTTATPDFVIPLNLGIESGKHLLVATSVAQGASVGFKCFAVCGDY